MELGIRSLLREKEILMSLPEDRRVFIKTGRLAVEVTRDEALELIERKLKDAERLLKDALEKIQAAFRALAEMDEARFKQLAAEIGLLIGVIPQNRQDLEALEKAIKEELALLA